jgi:hypothetical protein
MENASPDHANLFVVGVNKAGTSWLYKLLQEHPDVFMSSQKELFYFGERHPEELTDYHAHFPFDRPYRYFGEATPFYCHDAAVARKIHDYAPDAKVLAIVRDPIDRLYSQFYYQKQLGHVSEEAGPEALLSPEAAKFRWNSHYETLLPPFAETFGPEQFKLVSLEAAGADPDAFWSELQRFLDVRPAPRPTAGEGSTNATGSPVFRAVYRRLVSPMQRHAPALYRALLGHPLARAAKDTLLRLLGTADKQALPDDVAAELRAEFQPTYRYLAEQGIDAYDKEAVGR